jgi:DNA topoisomerase 2-associated protein PAT1
LDEFNDETFGASVADVGISSRDPMLTYSGRDFDFFGKTAKIADVMEEEQMTYARSHGTQQPPPTQAARQAEAQYQQQQSNYARQQAYAQQSRPSRSVSSAPMNTNKETTRSESCNLG